MLQKVTLDCECAKNCMIVQAISGLSIGVILVDPDGRITWLNRAATNILGVNQEECLQAPIESLLRDPELARFWESAASADGNILESVSVHWPGRLELKLSATRYRDVNGDELGRALVVCDVTADRRLQVEMSQAVASRLLDITNEHQAPNVTSRLTQQELRVLRLVGGGLSNDEIASQVSISASTVRSHLKSVYRKLGLGSRSEAVSFAVRNHLC